MTSHPIASPAPHVYGAAAPVLVVLAASAGGIDALGEILAALPPHFPAALAIVQHRTLAWPNRQALVLGRRSVLPVAQVDAPGGAIEAGHVYLAPPDRHLVVTSARRFDLLDGRRIRHLRSSANPLFTSAAAAYGPNAIAVVLTGSDGDGTDGVQSVTAMGGTVIAQDPRTARFPGMPESAIASHAVSVVLPLEAIAPALTVLVAQALSRPLTC